MTLIIDTDYRPYVADEWVIDADYAALEAEWDAAAEAFELACSWDIAMAEARDAAGMPDNLSELLQDRRVERLGRLLELAA